MRETSARVFPSFNVWAYHEETGFPSFAFSLSGSTMFVGTNFSHKQVSFFTEDQTHKALLFGRLSPTCTK
jgi:hypothetical protein